MQLQSEHPTIAVQDRLAPLHERDLQVEVLQDLDERHLEPRNLEPVLDAADEADGVDLGADVLEEASDEACRAKKDESESACAE